MLRKLMEEFVNGVRKLMWKNQYMAVGQESHDSKTDKEIRKTSQYRQLGMELWDSGRGDNDILQKI